MISPILGWLLMINPIGVETAWGGVLAVGTDSGTGGGDEMLNVHLLNGDLTTKDTEICVDG